MAQRGGADDPSLQSRIANLEHLADRLAHELTTPLTTAHGFASLLLARLDLPPDVRQAVERIERATGRALGMLHSRMDEGVGDAPRALRVRALVRDVIAELLGDETPVGRDLPEDAQVFGDPGALRVALTLVLGAIVDHAAAAGVDAQTVRVTIAQVRADAHVLRVSVAAPPLAQSAFDDERVRAAGAVDPEGVTGRLQRARLLVGALGGRLWLDDPAATSPGVSVLLKLPRDVATPEGDAATDA